MKNIKIILTLAWRNLWRNKSRTAIMISATLFAVLLAVLMKSVQEGMYDRQIKNVVSFYSGYLQIQNQAYADDKSLDNSLVFDDATRESIQNTPDVSAFAPRIESFILAGTDDITKGVLITGTNPEMEDGLTGLRKKVIKGEYFLENEATLMLGKGLATYLKVDIGDTIVFLGSGYHGATAVGKYPIKALLEFGAPQLNDNMIYMPLAESQKLFAAPDLVTSVAINVNHKREMLPAQAFLQSQLDTSQYAVKNWEELMPDLVNSIEGDRSSGVIMLGVLYMIIGFVIYGTLLMMISERLREFSMLIAIGMKNRMIAFTLLIECIAMTLIGALFGILLSIPVTSWLQNSPIRLDGSAGSAYEKIGFEPVITAIVDINIMVTQAWLVVIMAILLSLYPMYKILKIKAVDSL